MNRASIDGFSIAFLSTFFAHSVLAAILRPAGELPVKQKRTHMKKKIKGIFFLLIFICSPSLVFAEAQIAPRLITVTGDAEVMVDPDE
ncbi:MAG: hypothetical protein CSB28_02245, partial [Desulfobacterales bacterium]